MPQTLSCALGTDRDYEFGFGSDSLARNPELSCLIAQVIACASDIDLALSVAVSKITGAESRAGHIIFSAIQSSRARSDVLTRLSDDMLTGGIRRIFKIGISAYELVSSQRNKFAHHIWGYCDKLPENLLLIDPKHQLSFYRQMDEHLAKQQLDSSYSSYETAYNSYEKMMEILSIQLQHARVYTKEEVESALCTAIECRSIWDVLFLLLGDVDLTLAERNRLYRKLLGISLFQKTKMLFGRKGNRKKSLKQPS